MDLKDWWLSLLSSPYFQALLTVVGAIVLAVIADWVITRVLKRVTRMTRTTFDETMVDVLHRPIFSSIVLLGLYLAIPLLGLAGAFHSVALSLIKTAAVLIWSIAVLRLAGSLLERLSHVAERVLWLNERTLPLIDNVAKIAILGLAAYFLFLSWKIDVTAWLASAGIIGLALGFAARESLANLFGGFSIMMDAPYKVGDFIVLDTGERGQVTQIGLRSSRILTRDDVEVTIPNAQIANAKIVNESGGPWPKHRVRAAIGVAYGSDVDRVSDVLKEAAQSIEYASEEPEPLVRFMEFGDSSLVFSVLCWIDDPVYRGRAIDALNKAIYKALNREGIVIPFPQRDLYLKQMPQINGS